jgi:hypothetical protein
VADRGVRSMRIRTTIDFSADETRWNEVREVFEAAGVEPPADPSPLDLYFVEVPSGVDLEFVRSALRERNFEWDEARRAEYDESDLDGAAALLLYAPPSEVIGGPANGTRYDLGDACHVCGTGAVQTSLLMLDPRELGELNRGSRAFATLRGETLVDRELSSTFEALQPGIATEQAIDLEGRPLPWYQVKATAVLPPFSRRSSGFLREDECRTCRRDGYFDDAQEPLQLVYDEPFAQTGVAVTWEWFGKSQIREPFHESHLAHPKIIVSQGFRQALQSAAAPFKYEPLQVT